MQRLDQYINNVIDYSRNKRLTIEIVKVDIDDVITTCLSDLRYFVNDTNVKLKVDLNYKMLKTDLLRFKIITNNLISNAFKYRDPSKKRSIIAIKSHLDKSDVVLQIQDNGMGIDPKYIDKIWDMFFRATSERNGSGLGLYILKESANAIGAAVHVESDLGIGTTFTVRFPLDPGVV
jgi:signal transduction histidine kinase